MRRRAALVAVLALLAPACARDEVDPKWELAIRKGMPFVDATPIESPSAMFSTEPNGLRQTFETFFVRAFLEARTEDYFVLETTGPQRWLKTHHVENHWRAFHLVLMPDKDLVLRCYPRVGDMTYYDSDFFTDSPKMKANTWYQVKVFVRLFRQLSDQPVRDLRLDLVGHRRITIRIAAFYVERER